MPSRRAVPVQMPARGTASSALSPPPQASDVVGSESDDERFRSPKLRLACSRRYEDEASAGLPPVVVLFRSFQSWARAMTAGGLADGGLAAGGLAGGSLAHPSCPPALLDVF